MIKINERGEIDDPVARKLCRNTMAFRLHRNTVAR